MMNPIKEKSVIESINIIQVWLRMLLQQLKKLQNKPVIKNCLPKRRLTTRDQNKSL